MPIAEPSAIIVTCRLLKRLCSSLSAPWSTSSEAISWALGEADFSAETSSFELMLDWQLHREAQLDIRNEKYPW